MEDSEVNDSLLRRDSATSETDRWLLTSSDDSDSEAISRSPRKISADSYSGYYPESAKTSVPSFARQFSVQSHTHSFNVTTYGPESAQHPINSIVTEPILEEQEERSFDGSADRISNDVILIMPTIDESSLDNDLRDMKANETIPTVQRPKTKGERTFFEIAKRGRLFAKRKKDRLIGKNGECMVAFTKVSDRGTRLLSDFFTTMLELKWRYHLLMFMFMFGSSWIVFGLIWWALSAMDINLYQKRIAKNLTNEEHVPCMLGVDDFPSALLFSIETQHTIGYGTRSITTSCPVAMGVMMFQSMFGVIMQCILTGIIFAKMARPKRRAQTIIFSKSAVISKRNGERFLMFRVGDIRRSQIINVTIRAMLVERKVTKEGEHLPLVTQDIAVTTQGGSDYFFLAWPITVMHKIDKTSPLWNISEEDLLSQEWELIIVLEGVAELTGATFQVRTSYLPTEILWGYIFKSLHQQRAGFIHEIDYTHFHETEPSEIKCHSARRASTKPHTTQEPQQLSKNVKILENNNEVIEMTRMGNGDCAF